ncbi:MAG: type II secretion system protein GspM [Gammaproteobacteria bacterium]|nr:type II secretion system protein GspM [Gammaproteobacteria bacterium]MDE0330121.1 type II secretion system protein GspM [Anaerolineaceae bacterium]MDE0414494.1 type II secretion system protein GspM [Gammaproteobacteria bacterium]
MAAIAEFWRARSAREQALLAALAVMALAAIWYFAAVAPLLDRSESYKQRRAAETALLERLDRVGSRITALPAPRPRSDASLLLLVNRSVRDAGLGGFLEDGAADGETRVRLRLRDAPFPQVSAWLAGLAVQEGIRTVSADIERGPAPGITQVSLVLERSD